MAEEHEIEEGEIYDDLVYSYSDLKIPKEERQVEGDYDDSHIDIDAKIQSVLGDYIKDFEGAVSAENLGPKYGVYGSFLPIDQLSSDLHTASHCPELTTSGDKPPVAPFIIQGDSIRCSKGTSIDVKAHNGREVSVKKRKWREQDYLGNELGESDANAFESKFRKQKKSKANKYRVKHQSEAESGMIRKPVYKTATGYGKVARAYIAYW
ncbi:hypothetical protein MTR67_036130 [Solanum verrucosum]|uniref:Uncharacterized protein n=1 Tax=Solanum verrucosum TaxID=315347 RepID=A0AAF0UB07_SOLVR|nr:hypothetical protein MTR67_036130 [Solanum verrucosum]